MTPQQYRRAFGIDDANPGADSSILRAALDHARDNRKFEIELYWKRATYFWTLIAAAFAGYFAILATDKSDPPSNEKQLLAFAIACIGLVFTFAWFQVNRGSKQWQENWENHVDMLEDKITGPLYKTIMQRPRDADDEELSVENVTGVVQRLNRRVDLFLVKHVTGPAPISVSQVNQMVNLFTAVVWGMLAIHVSGLAFEFRPPSWERLFVLIATSVFFLLLLTKCRTGGSDHQHVAYLRETIVLDGETLAEARRKAESGK